MHGDSETRGPKRATLIFSARKVAFYNFLILLRNIAQIFWPDAFFSVQQFRLVEDGQGGYYILHGGTCLERASVFCH